MSTAKVNEGQPTQINCSSDGFPPPTLSIRTDVNVTLMTNITESRKSSYVFYAQNITRSTQFTCDAMNGEGQQSVSTPANVFSKCIFFIIPWMFMVHRYTLLDSVELSWYNFVFEVFRDKFLPTIRHIYTSGFLIMHPSHANLVHTYIIF